MASTQNNVHLLEKRAFGELNNVMHKEGHGSANLFRKNVSRYEENKNKIYIDPTHDRLNEAGKNGAKKVNFGASKVDNYFMLRDFPSECCTNCAKSDEQVWSELGSTDKKAMENIWQHIFKSNNYQQSEENLSNYHHEFFADNDEVTDIISILQKPLLYLDNYMECECSQFYFETPE